MTTLAADRSHTTPWISSFLPTYTVSLACLTLVGAAFVAAAPPAGVVATALMVAAVALVGLPHGAYDGVIGRRLTQPRFGRLWWVVFGGLYLASAAAGVVLWVTVPWLGLGSLLVLGALHWGLDDLEAPPRSMGARVWFALSRGAVPVAAPLAAHPERIAEIFAVLTCGGVDAGAISTAGWIAALAALPGIAAQLIVILRTDRRAGLRVALELAALVAWFVAADPLLGFTLYFCFWHAVRHSLRTAATLDPSHAPRAAWRYIRGAAAPTAMTWVLALLVWIMIDRGVFGSGLSDPGLSDPGATTEHAWWGIVFVGLYALTLPHVALEWIVSRVQPAASSAPRDEPR